MVFLRPVTEVIHQRYSCRNYVKSPIEKRTLIALQQVIKTLATGPFGILERFELIAASAEDQHALRGLGTYGFIRNPPAFLIGVACPAPFYLENFGYRMEMIVLQATELGLGTCWLGGTFNRSSFMHKVQAVGEEGIPAVVSVGSKNDNQSLVDQAIRQGAGSQQRLDWKNLFFDAKFGTPLSSRVAGEYAGALEMVRIGPSASNKQPWRIVKEGNRWHFYLQRSPGYRDWWVVRLMAIADMQRIDLGIAMCHFALAAGEAGIEGRWAVQRPNIEIPKDTEYIATWNGEAA